jgi:hypothetical protein
VLACGLRALAHVSYLESTRAKAQLNRDQADQFYTGNLANFAPGLTSPRYSRSFKVSVPSRTITLTLGDLPFSWQDRF